MFLNDSAFSPTVVYSRCLFISHPLHRDWIYSLSVQFSHPVVSHTLRLHGLQPTRLPRPWDSPGNNTGVGCYFLLQCMKVQSEIEVAQSCPTLSDPMDCSLLGSSIHGIFQARVLEWGAIAFSDIINKITKTLTLEYALFSQ